VSQIIFLSFPKTSSDMYSQDIRDKLEEKDIELGDLITVSGREGRLMPKPESGDSDVVVLKDESGYNLGLEPENLELLEKMDGIEESKGLEASYSDDTCIQAAQYPLECRTKREVLILLLMR